MLKILNHWSEKLQWTKSAAILVGVVAFVTFIATVTNSQSTTLEFKGISDGLIFSWSLLLTMVLSIFPTAPKKTRTIEKIFSLLKIQNKHVFDFLVSMAFVLLSVAVIWLNLNYCDIWQNGFF